LATATLEAGQTFVVVPATEGTAMLTKDAKLAVITRATGTKVADVVVQARCS
jgi:hypothetical protein